MVSFGLVLGIINSIREGQKKHVISKIGLAIVWLGYCSGRVSTFRPSKYKPYARNEQELVYFALLFGGIGLMFYGEGVRAIMELPSIISHILSYTRIVGILLASVILADVIDFIFINTLHHNILYIILGSYILCWSYL